MDAYLVKCPSNKKAVMKEGVEELVATLIFATNDILVSHSLIFICFRLFIIILDY